MKRSVAMDDLGTIITPWVAHGRLQAGIVYGITSALYEQPVSGYNVFALSDTLMGDASATTTPLRNGGLGRTSLIVLLTRWLR